MTTSRTSLGAFKTAYCSALAEGPVHYLFVVDLCVRFCACGTPLVGTATQRPIVL